ncbi:MAG: hypothetical protein ACI9N9_000058 [Enterobacterales bacterium]|jgi:hypothetical protein
MAKELPYFRFTSQNWQNGKISLESYAVKGLFIDICAYYWVQDCSITLKMLNKKFRNAKKNIALLIKLDIMTHSSSTDEVSILYLNEQYDILSQARINKQIAGKKGGEKKASNAKAEPKHSSSYKDKDNYKENNKDNNNDNTLLLVQLQNEDGLTQNEKIAFSFWKLFKKNILESGVKKTATLDKARLESWTNEVRLMIEVDDRNEEELKRIWNYLNTVDSKFWHKNIVSTSKLREKFERLYMESKEKEYKSSGGVSLEYLQKLKERLGK